MATLTEDMRSYFGKQLPMVATADKYGKPNIGPKRSCRIYDESTLIFNENTGGQTLKNIRDTNLASIALVDWQKLDGYRFSGKAYAYTEGDYYEACLEYAKKTGGKEPKAAVVLKIEEIYTLKIGQDAGKRLQ